MNPLRDTSLLLLLAFLAACGTGGTVGVCGEAARVSSACGGYEVSAPDQMACEQRVTAACTAVEWTLYQDYLACADYRCRYFSPDREIAASCDSMLATVSDGCYAAGVIGNSDYRYCAGGVDQCRCGETCNDASGVCEPAPEGCAPDGGVGDGASD
jgi:hypothetical protein